MLENTIPSTKFDYAFCARIGPLQLGIVLVKFKFEQSPMSLNL